MCCYVWCKPQLLPPGLFGSSEGDPQAYWSLGEILHPKSSQVNILGYLLWTHRGSIWQPKPS